MKSRIAILLGVALATVAHAGYEPVPLTPASFTQDIIIEKEAPPPLANFTTATIDQGTNNYGNTFFQQGYIPTLPWIGLPAPGTDFESPTDPNRTYRMPSSYQANNVAFIGAKNIPGTSTLQTQSAKATLTVDSPVASLGLSVLYAAGGGGSPFDGNGMVNVTVHHADNSTEPFQFDAGDWFDGTTTYGWIARGRVDVSGSGPLNNLRSTTATKLFYADLFLANITSPVTSVDFEYTSGDYRVFVFGLSTSQEGIAFTPVTVSGFNRDIVVEAGAPVSYVLGATVSMDQGTNNYGNTWFEQGFATRFGTGNNGLPHPGTTITSGNYAFQMPASYTDNNCVFIGAYEGYTTGSFTLSSPATYAGISILNSAGNGPANMTFTIYYDDGTTQEGTLASPNWFDIPAASLIFTASGRVQLENFALNNLGGATACQLAHSDIALINTTASVTNISFTYVDGGRAGLFAVSAQTTSGGNYSPIAVTGYSADIIVEASQERFPGSMYTATTATMDAGTNNWNWTWFERGWVTNGAVTASGLPPAGSILPSLQDATRHYQMPATYTGPNAILIDVNHQVANITPLVPASYSAFALLTAGASIGSANTMTNLCILQHADGTDETNVFYGYDWFNTVIPPAFIANGRGDTRYTIAGSVFGNPQQPRLFETIFPLSNVSSPVTNIQVQYKLAGGTSWTTYVLAVSAAAGAVAPVFAVPTPSINVYEGATVSLVVPVSGTEPITNQWQFSADGTTWVNLSDEGNRSGSQTTNLVYAGCNWANAGFYRLVASNPGGASTNVAGRISVFSSLPDVTQPGDLITRINGNPGGGGTEGEANAVDNTILKYLNFDSVDNAAPFVGPVGFIVTPAAGKTLVTALRIYAANDAEERDPADVTIEGSSDNAVTWSPIASSALALPSTRNTVTTETPNPLVHACQEIRFANDAKYTDYRITFNNVKNNTTASSMQLAEVELLGTLDLPTLTIAAGASGTLTLAVSEPGTLLSTTNLVSPVIWADEGAISDTMTITPAVGVPAKYYRLRVP